jgi:uncharacterized protein YidB (DUF937 family)
MDFNELFKMGADLIQNNSDSSTTGLDTKDISDALGKLLGAGENGIDLSSIVSKLTDGNLSETIASWLGNGQNLPISADTITDLLGSDKVSEFAKSLGLTEESAKGAIADALPEVVNKATSGENSIFGEMLDKVGGVDGAMNMLGKMFK